MSETEKGSALFVSPGVERGLRFFVPGLPQTAGSKRAFRLKTGKIVVTDANPKGREWRAVIVDMARQAVGNGVALLLGPLTLELKFGVPRPKGHYGKHGLLKSAPQWPAKRPDLTKWIRCVEDALTGVIWHDDAQIVEQYAVKRYSDVPGVEVFVSSQSASEPMGMTGSFTESEPNSLLESRCQSGNQER